MGEEVANYISFGKESGRRKEHLLIQTIITFSLLAVAVHISFICSPSTCFCKAALSSLKQHWPCHLLTDYFIPGAVWGWQDHWQCADPHLILFWCGACPTLQTKHLGPFVTILTHLFFVLRVTHLERQAGWLWSQCSWSDTIIFNNEPATGATFIISLPHTGHPN